MKPRSDSRLFQLTGDQQAQLYDWIVTLGFPKAKQLLAAPPPDGFSVKAHLSSLHSFYIRYGAARQCEAAADAAGVKTPPGSQLFTIAERGAHSGAFLLSTSPFDTHSFRELSRWVISQQTKTLKTQGLSIAERQLALAEKRHAFDREKFELNSARLALKHLAALQQIHGDENLDGESQIRAAREVLYGPRSLGANPDPQS